MDGLRQLHRAGHRERVGVSGQTGWGGAFRRARRRDGDCGIPADQAAPNGLNTYLSITAEGNETDVKQPRLKSHLLPVTTSAGQTFLFTEIDVHLLVGNQVTELATEFDGSRRLADIVGGRSIGATAAAMLAAQKYARAGMLAEGPEPLPSRLTAYWEGVGQDATAVAGRLAAASVRLRTVGGASLGGLPELLRGNGIRVLESQDPNTADITVVIADDYANPELEAINSDQLARSEPWFLVKPDGYWPWNGPLLVPGETGCWECLRQRLDINRMVEQYLRQFHGFERPQVLTRSELPSARQVIEALAVTAITTYLATGETDSVGQIRSYYVPTSEFHTHQLIRIPQCPSCGDPKLLHRDPRIVLEGKPIAFSTDGGFRSIPPDETFRRLEKHISRITGAISWLNPLPTDDSGMSYSYVAGHNFAMSRNDINVLRKNLRGNSGGKGRTEMQAKVSGMCEAIERYSGCWSPDRPTVHCRADQLDGRAILPNDLMTWSDEQYRDRVEINADPLNALHRVPHRFDPQASIDWTAVWSMTEQETVYVPAAYAWFGHPECAKNFHTYGDGNGNAAGNTLEEAVLQGFLELVERDAVSIWWYNRLHRPQVDIDSFDEPYFRQMREYYDGMGRDLWVLDISTDLPIPVFAAVSPRRHATEDVIVAFGAHLDPKLAAMRALTEANQFLPAVFQRDAEGRTVYADEDPETLRWFTTATISNNPWLAPTERIIRREDHPIPPVTTVADCVEHCVDAAAAVGLEVLVLDQSRPDLDIRVAKVMAPGMRHFWRRLGPGRLYDVPVKLGDQSEPTPYDALNPLSVFF